MLVHADQVLFSPQSQHLLPNSIEPLKIVVRIHTYPGSQRHIRQLKSSSIGEYYNVHACRLMSLRGTILDS